MKIMTDSPIRFPGLFGDWTITLSSKAINIGNGIYWYGILIALGMLVALWWCMRQRTKYGIREDDLIDGLLWGIPSAIVGARLYYVLFYLSEFKDHEGHFSWSKAIAIWAGISGGGSRIIFRAGLAVSDQMIIFALRCKHLWGPTPRPEGRSCGLSDARGNIKNQKQR